MTLSNQHDTTPRYAPSKVIISTDKGFYEAAVQQYKFHPANTHPQSPIKNEMNALELVTAYGSRWYGCDKAYINSELRMVVIGFDSRDEVRSKWTVAEVL